MNFYGNLIGLVAEEVGKKKVVLELTIEDNSWMSIKSIQESMNGLTGECKPTLRKLSLTFGRRNWKVSILMTRRLYSRNSER